MSDVEMGKSENQVSWKRFFIPFFLVTHICLSWGRLPSSQLSPGRVVSIATQQTLNMGMGGGLEGCGLFCSLEVDRCQ